MQLIFNGETDLIIMLEITSNNSNMRVPGAKIQILERQES